MFRLSEAQYKALAPKPESKPKGAGMYAPGSVHLRYRGLLPARCYREAHLWKEEGEKIMCPNCGMSYAVPT